MNAGFMEGENPGSITFRAKCSVRNESRTSELSDDNAGAVLTGYIINRIIAASGPKPAINPSLTPTWSGNSSEPSALAVQVGDAQGPSLS
jgi:hypothetical protein